MTTLDEAYFRTLVDFSVVQARVRERLADLSAPPRLLRFFIQYASWNGAFANGVAALTSLIGRQRGLFREAGFPHAVADRSNYVASFFFDAARDEYDDHINPERDSHRCMAQAALIAMQDYFALPATLLDEVEPQALLDLNDDVLAGYTGEGHAGAVAQAFAAMGYHLGSELLADEEFTLIDQHMRQHQGPLVQHLMRTTVTLGGATHRCYAWVGVHSGHGGGVEAEHFEHAAQGARHALAYLPPDQADTALAALAAGFRRFDQDHARFFAIPV